MTEAVRQSSSPRGASHPKDGRERSGVGLRSPGTHLRSENGVTHLKGHSGVTEDDFEARLTNLRTFEFTPRQELQLAFIERLLGFAKEREAGRERLLNRAALRLLALESMLFASTKAQDDSTEQPRAAVFPPPVESSPEPKSLATPPAPNQAGSRKHIRATGAARVESEVHERLTTRLSERGSIPPVSRAPDALALAEQLYNTRVGTVRMDKAAASFEEGLPPEAGPYHSTTVASDAFKALYAQAPELLRAWLQRIENLSVALSLEGPNSD